MPQKVAKALALAEGASGVRVSGFKKPMYDNIS